MSRRTAGNVFIEKQGPLSMEAETTKVKRGRGRPRKDPTDVSETRVVLTDATAAIFRKAKSEYEKDLPYELTVNQFMKVLIKAHSKNQ